MIHIATRGEDQQKTKDQLIEELHRLRQQVADLQTQTATQQAMTASFKYETNEYRQIQSQLWEERFRALAENIEDVFWVISPGRSELIYVSPAYATIWQRPAPPLQSKFPDILLDTIHPDDRTLVASRFRRLPDLNYRAAVEFRILTPDDSVRWIRAQTFPILDEAGMVYGIAGNAVDITWRKQTERALRESEEKFRALLESAPVAIIAIDGQGAIRLVNAKTVEMFGYTRSELLGASLMSLLPERAHTRHAAYIARYFASPHARPMGQFMPLSGIRHSGEEFPVEIGLSSIQARGELLAVAYITDITLRRQAEDALQGERVRISMDLHDGVIQSLYAIGMQLALMETAEHNFRDITRGIDGVIEDIRGYILNLRSTAEHSRTLYECLVQDVLVRLHIPDTISIDIDIPNTHFPLASDHLEALCQMTNEAISNALRHAHARHIRVSLQQVEKQVLMMIADDGQGFTLEAALQHNGLGIRNLYERARQHGGTVEFQSAPDQGTTVTIGMPVALN
jgi:PAS domain S-box-containing protein